MTTTEPTPSAGAGAVSGADVASRAGRPALRIPGWREVAVASSLALVVLAATSTGSLVVAAVLVGVVTADRWRGAAALLAVTAVSIRFGTATFDDLAGIQSVLGPAVVVGPPVAAASAWCAGAAILLAARVPPVLVAEPPALRWWGPVGTGLLAAVVLAGTGPHDVWPRVVASVICVAVAVALSVLDRRSPWLRARWVPALVAGATACVLAGWPA